jgi:DNA-binding CsgD family transcriptional regulator
MPGTTVRPPQIVGRKAELERVLRFAGDAAASPAALVVTGGPGIGKSTLWSAGVEAARERRARVLVARPSEAETHLSYAALADLLADVGRDDVEELPAPQWHALQVALLRAEPEEGPLEPGAISTALHGALRALARRRPVLVAVDDVQWLDPPTATALAYALRRLAGRAVRVLLARRDGHGSPVEEALEAWAPDRLALTPLTPSATGRLLEATFDTAFPPRVVRETHRAAAGNPLFAIEIGRILTERGMPAEGEEPAVPVALDALLGARVGALPPALRRLLLTVSLAGGLPAHLLEQIAEAETIERALAERLVLVDGGHARPGHPLLAAAAVVNAPRAARREVHGVLAQVAGDAERRARHLALAAEEPDGELAAQVSAAAASAAARAAAEDAVELAEHALRLTPDGDPARTDRLLDLAEYLSLAGEPGRLTELLEPELDALPPGPARARGLLLLADGGTTGMRERVAVLERALEACGDDLVLRAPVVAELYEEVAVAGVERVAEAAAAVDEVLPAALGEATDASTEVRWRVITAAGWTRMLGGQPLDALVERSRTLPGATPLNLYRSLDRLVAVQLMWRGEAGEARERIWRLLAAADERGEGFTAIIMRIHLCELLLRVGECGAVAHVLDEWDGFTEYEAVLHGVRLRFRALLAATEGRAEDVARPVARVLAETEETGMRWDALEARRAAGLGALLRGEHDRAARELGAVWEHCEREGVRDPGTFPVAGDLAEALAAAGDAEGAGAVAAALRARAGEQDHPWARVTAERSGALARLAADPGDEGAADALGRAAGGYEALGLPFERARALLARGRALAGQGAWGPARAALEDAAAGFEVVGCWGWADAARAELRTVAAHRPEPEAEVTRAERRVIELAAAGLSDREIAQALLMSAAAVRAHLRRACDRLGAASREELAARVRGGR